MPIRRAETHWRGTLSKGRGKVRVGSGSVRGDCSLAGSVESGRRTNPEELLGASLAESYTMTFSLLLEQAGYPPKALHSTAHVTSEVGPRESSITDIVLDTEAEVPDISFRLFEDTALLAKSLCPVAKALASTTITLHAKLL